ncbi:MAG: hypothetical protein ACE144_08895 [Thermodesulfobacteriota bacterium]
MKLLHEATFYRQNIRIEMVASGRGHRSGEEHPVATIGLAHQTPTVQFSDSLGREQRIEAIAHELLHLLLVYRFGLGVIGRRVPYPGDSRDVFNYYMSMRGDWVYLLGQIANTAHHLILIDYLREEYGIEDRLHICLLQQNFSVAVNDDGRDKESQYGKGIVTFEYEEFIGNVSRVIQNYPQTEFFRKAYHVAKKHFGSFSFQSIPNRSSYEEDILSLLEDLGYEREDFLFFPTPANIPHCVSP